MLTTLEATILHDSAWEELIACALRSRWRKRVLCALPFGVLLAAASVFATGGSLKLAAGLLVGGIAAWIHCAAPFLPVYTPYRARAIRYTRRAALPLTLVLASGSAALESLPLLFLISCLCGCCFCWIEWTRNSIRRKLPTSQWPKHLYF